MLPSASRLAFRLMPLSGTRMSGHPFVEIVADRRLAARRLGGDNDLPGDGIDFVSRNLQPSRTSSAKCTGEIVLPEATAPHSSYSRWPESRDVTRPVSPTKSVALNGRCKGSKIFDRFIIKAVFLLVIDLSNRS